MLLVNDPQCLKSTSNIGQIWQEGQNTEVFPLLEAVQPYVEGAHGRLMQCHDLSVGGICFVLPFSNQYLGIFSCNLYQVWTLESASHAYAYEWLLSSV